MKKDRPIREIQPVVVPEQFYIFGPLISFFISLFPGMFAFVISNIIAGISSGHTFSGPFFSIAIIVYILSFCVVMYLVYLKIYKEPEKSCYRIYADRMEYEEGLLNKQRRTVIFDQVIDIQLTEGVLQQKHNAGTIILMTQQLVSQGQGNLSNRRVSLSNIPNPQETYELLQSLAMEKEKPATT